MQELRRAAPDIVAVNLRRRWNPAVEQQAQDRIHRLGQYKPIAVTRFIIGGTIEERILKLQARAAPLLIHDSDNSDDDNNTDNNNQSLQSAARSHSKWRRCSCMPCESACQPGCARPLPQHLCPDPGLLRHARLLVRQL
jgi:hypothetical protein